MDTFSTNSRVVHERLIFVLPWMSQSQQYESGGVTHYASQQCSSVEECSPRSKWWSHLRRMANLKTNVNGPALLTWMVRWSPYPTVFCFNRSCLDPQEQQKNRLTLIPRLVSHRFNLPTRRWAPPLSSLLPHTKDKEQMKGSSPRISLLAVCVYGFWTSPSFILFPEGLERPVAGP